MLPSADIRKYGSGNVDTMRAVLGWGAAPGFSRYREKQARGARAPPLAKVPGSAAELGRII